MDPRLRGNDSWGRGGGVLSFLFFAAELSSAFSFLVFVILADAGTHRIASAVAWFYRFITGVSVDLATLSPRHPRERGDPLYSERRGSVLALHCRCCCWFRFRRCLSRQVRFQTRLLARADEWNPVYTGMTVGGVAAVR